ncbi:MAG: PilZ domain-containing protein [Kofleriaceae bacterium]
MTDNRRTATRHPVDLPCAVREEASRDARIVNLSVGGALIEYPRRPMGARVHVTFRVPTLADAIEIGAIVRWSTDTEIGVQFDGMRPQDVWAINKYFESL